MADDRCLRCAALIRGAGDILCESCLDEGLFEDQDEARERFDRAIPGCLEGDDL